MHVVNARVGRQSDAQSMMCRLQPRLTKATVKEIVDGPWPSDGQDMSFTPNVLPTLPDEKGPPSRTLKESPEAYQIIRYVSLHPFDLRIRSLLQLYFSRVADEKLSRPWISPKRRTPHSPNLRSSIYEVLQRA